MTDEEEQIAFKQWLKAWGDKFPPMDKKTMFSVYRSMDEANRREFFGRSKRRNKMRREDEIEKELKYYSWHDLTKNPNNLPTPRERVLLCIEVQREKWNNFYMYIEGIYDESECLGQLDKCWLFQDPEMKCRTEISNKQKVVAWKGLDKFELDKE